LAWHASEKGVGEIEGMAKRLGITHRKSSLEPQFRARVIYTAESERCAYWCTGKKNGREMKELEASREEVSGADVPCRERMDLPSGWRELVRTRSDGACECK